MNEDTRPVIPKLEYDGSNWVTYHNHLLMAVEVCNLECHLDSATITAEYQKGAAPTAEENTKWRIDN